MAQCKKCGLGRGHKVTCPLRPKDPAHRPTLEIVGVESVHNVPCVPSPSAENVHLKDPNPTIIPGRSRIVAGIYRECRLLNAPALLAGTERPMTANFVFRAGDVNRIDDRMFHYVYLVTPRVWTLFLCPRKDEKRKWGFLVGDSSQGYRFETATEHLRKKPGASSNAKVIDG